MYACQRGHVDTARVLVGEFHANIDIQDNVREIVRWVLCGDVDHVFRGCVRGRGYWHIFGFHICYPN